MDDRLDRKDAVFHVFHIFIQPHNVAMLKERNGIQLPLFRALVKMGERKNKIKHSGDRMKIKECLKQM